MTDLDALSPIHTPIRVNPYCIPIVKQCMTVYISLDFNLPQDCAFAECTFRCDILSTFKFLENRECKHITQVTATFVVIKTGEIYGFS